MADKIFSNIKIQLRTDSLANWNSLTDFIPLKGELIIITDVPGDTEGETTTKMKIGDGVTALADLSYFETGSASGGKSEIVINGVSGSDFTITPASINAVSTDFQVNGKKLNGTGITLSASDVSALPSSTTYVSSVNGSSGAVTIASGNSIVMSSSQPQNQKSGDLWLRTI